MPRTLSLDSLLENKEEIFIRNVHKPRGIIVLSLTDRNGRPEREIIPNTKLPISLNGRLTPEMIGNSRDLRRLLFEGVLELVEPKEALKILEDPTKREELSLAYKNATGKHIDVDKMREVEEDKVSTYTQGSSVMAGIPSELQEKLSQAEEEIGLIADDEEDSDVQTKVKTIIAQLSSEPPQIKNREAKFQLSTLDLTSADLYYIINNTVAQGVVNKYAKEQLAALTGESVEDNEE